MKRLSSTHSSPFPFLDRKCIRYEKGFGDFAVERTEAQRQEITCLRQSFGRQPRIEPNLVVFHLYHFTSLLFCPLDFILIR